MPIGGWPRGASRAAAAPLLVAIALLAGCGGGDEGTEREKASDAELLNAALGQELALLGAYRRAQSAAPGGRARRTARLLRAQGQEYVDALTKAVRGLGAETEAEEVELEPPEAGGRGGSLALVYELENAALAAYLDAAPRLHTAAPRTLAASLATGHAQHLVVLRQALGADPAAAVPEAFESGEEPPPGAPAPADRG